MAEASQRAKAAIAPTTHANFRIIAHAPFRDLNSDHEQILAWLGRNLALPCPYCGKISPAKNLLFEWVVEMDVEVRLAKRRDLKVVKKLADEHRRELGFVKLASLEKAIQERRLLVAVVSSSLVPRPSSRIIGFVHFRCCKDGHATIYEIVVAPEWRGKGVGRKLVEAVCTHARSRSCTCLRLKCPIDLPANGFYQRLGFIRIGIENPDGNRRPLAIWELDLQDFVHSTLNSQPTTRWQFYVGLTADASSIRALVRRFYEGYSGQPPFHPFERIIVSPLFVPPATLRLLRSWRTGESSPVSHAPCPVSLIFDSGGYQVQTGKLTYEELCRELRRVYEQEARADFYVLPDHVPTSRDSDAEVERKIKETLTMGELFLKWVFQGTRDTGQVIGVVHGRTVKQIREGVRKWHELGVRYIAFGSFGTSGRDGSVNLLSQNSLKLLKALQDEALSLGMKFHIFGIGNPTYLVRLKNEGIEPTSFDSTGWWKAGGFGYVFAVDGKGTTSLRICLTRRITTSLERAQRFLRKSGHVCPFCADEKSLRRFRWHRLLHNLATFVEIAIGLSN
ncbi:N-acetyltransferase [Fervidibacter sacchari]|uniref:Ribosomal protein S18 acetylase RimI-like enzyme n=1 Tax=Candidatus Fervidibacter sacchari TaxID=1448929 RepID=A0ABT2ETQ0_9BACT|nr:N-acetyltransferase [Candidatus Fervidibacter sacchari]MCS3921024.1 ribosomal protein S18 acetylase RimI-like enzyme [Candidatus Fervidibacter sacchari]WKU14966.1 N-acetyltransferase [Candidatus Fervidibacter sacchari]